jgi:hypothetical protein
MRRTAIPKLAGLAEIAALLAERAGHGKPSRSYASSVAGRADFPEPVQRLAMGPVWIEAEAKAYIDGGPRKPGRKPKTEQQPVTTAGDQP